MDKSEFLTHATSFDACGVVVITSGEYQEARSLACDARDAIQQSGGSAVVYDAETLVAHTHDAYVGKSLQFWEPEEKYYAGQYVVPSEMERADYVVFSRPFDCADSILQRLRFRCVHSGLSGKAQPPEFSPGGVAIGQRVADDEGRPSGYPGAVAVWEAEAFSGSLGTASSETGLVWEAWSLLHREASVILVPKETNPANELTGDAVTDAVLDVALAERPLFWPYQNPLGKPVRELFPYVVAQYLYVQASDEVRLVKSQVTWDGCDWRPS